MVLTSQYIRDIPVPPAQGIRIPSSERVPAVRLSVKAPLACKLPVEKLVVLSQSIETALAHKNSRVVYFAGASGREGAGPVAFETAIAATWQTKKNILFLDLSRDRGSQRQKLANACEACLTDTGLPQQIQAVNVENTSFSYAAAFHNGQQEDSTVSARTLKDFVRQSAQGYDLIVIHSGAAMNNGLAALCAELSGGIVLVAEAERTRAPVAKRLKEMLELSGGKVIGAVLTGRRFYIPSLIHALFFRSFGKKI
jgi:Mrp family chromosome partitioning ATPase